MSKETCYQVATIVLIVFGAVGWIIAVAEQKRASQAEDDADFWRRKCLESRDAKVTQ